MNGMKECLRDFKNFENVEVMKVGRKNKCSIKGYDKIKNGNFTINCVACVEGLKHKLISVP